DRGRPDEAPATLLQVLGDCRRYRRLAETGESGLVEARGAVVGAGLEAPEIGGERPGFGDKLDCPAGIVDGRDDLAAVADDAGIGEQALDVLFPELRDPIEIEACKTGPKILALAQDRQPRQAGLEPLEADLLEQPDIVGHRTAPFGVVVALVVLQSAVPPAAALAVDAFDQTRAR